MRFYELKTRCWLCMTPNKLFFKIQLIVFVPEDAEHFILCKVFQQCGVLSNRERERVGRSAFSTMLRWSAPFSPSPSSYLSRWAWPPTTVNQPQGGPWISLNAIPLLIEPYLGFFGGSESIRGPWIFFLCVKNACFFLCEPFFSSSRQTILPLKHHWFFVVVRKSYRLTNEALS